MRRALAARYHHQLQVQVRYGQLQLCSNIHDWEVEGLRRILNAPRGGIAGRAVLLTVSDVIHERRVLSGFSY
jgi:hypothetical protein